MSSHVAIRRRDFVAGAEHSKIEIFTQTAKLPRRPTPWGRIAIGDRVWMKWTPGREIVAAAIVDSLRQLPVCTVRQLRDTTDGFPLYDLDTYWDDLLQRKGNRLSAVVVYLADGCWLDSPFIPSDWPSANRDSWIVDPPGAGSWPTC